MQCGQTGGGNLLYANFNQDQRRGIRIYNCDPFGRYYEREEGGSSVCEMLFASSLVAQVGAGEPASFSPRRLQVINIKRESVVCELSFTARIQAVRLNRRRMAVLVDERIHLYDMATMRLLHTIHLPVGCRAGALALSPHADEQKCWLAYPSNDAGEVTIFDAQSMQAVALLQAHKSPISVMAFNPDGTLLATVSQKGTVIRVHSLPDGLLRHKFRRGTYPATIYSLSFNQASTLLVVSSDTDTCHIYRVSENGSDEAEPVGLASLRGMVDRGTRDFAHIRLSTSGVPNIAAINSQSNRVLLVTADGFFHIYSLDPERGGSCRLLRKHRYT